METTKCIPSVFKVDKRLMWSKTRLKFDLILSETTLAFIMMIDGPLWACIKYIIAERRSIQTAVITLQCAINLLSLKLTLRRCLSTIASIKLGKSTWCFGNFYSLLARVVAICYETEW